MGVIKYTREILTELYWLKGLSLGEIAMQMNGNRCAIRKAMVRCSVPRRSLSEANGPPKEGNRNPNWQGDDVSPAAGRERAQRRYKEQPCSICGAPGERHHKDGNTLNNAPSNIAWRCRKHHMIDDGRMERRGNDGRFIS